MQDRKQRREAEYLGVQQKRDSENRLRADAKYHLPSRRASARDRCRLKVVSVQPIAVVPVLKTRRRNHTHMYGGTRPAACAKATNRSKTRCKLATHNCWHNQRNHNLYGRQLIVEKNDLLHVKSISDCDRGCLVEEAGLLRLGTTACALT